MGEQKFVYVDVGYLKELEETAKKVDYYKGIIDGINMVADRKTEQTETHDLRTDTHECVRNNLAHGYSVFNADLCHFEDEPQTERSEQ